LPSRSGCPTSLRISRACMTRCMLTRATSVPTSSGTRWQSCLTCGSGGEFTAIDASIRADGQDGRIAGRSRPAERLPQWC
jgi:hypothetical protein